jgi:hypothetical protein
MPVQMQGTQQSGDIVTVEEIRMFMLDFPKYNILLDDFQFTQEEVNNAIKHAIEEFNYIPPILSTFYSPDNFPFKHIAVYGTVKHLLWGEALRQQRNQASATDGDVVPIDIHNKYQLFRDAAIFFGNEFRQLATEVKISLNINSAWGELPSGMAGTSKYVRN